MTPSEWNTKLGVVDGQTREIVAYEALCALDSLPVGRPVTMARLVDMIYPRPLDALSLRRWALLPLILGRMAQRDLSAYAVRCGNRVTWINGGRHNDNHA